MPDHQRWRSLESSLTIKKPAGQLRDEVIKAAALVWAHTPPRDPHNDRKAAAAVARYLLDEGVLHEQVSLERALTRAAVDRYLWDDLTHSQRSLKTLRTTLYCAGRVLYPREYPLPTTVPTRRAQATPPARSEDIAELYANLVYLPGQQHLRTQLVLDLVTGAGLKSSEIRRLRGGDVVVERLATGEEVVAVTVHYRGEVARAIPVRCPVRARRILDRARVVGQSWMMPVNQQGVVEYNAVNRASEYFTRKDLPGFDVSSLRMRWLVDLAATPGVSMSAFLQLSGIGDYSTLRDLAGFVEPMTPAELVSAVGSDRWVAA